MKDELKDESVDNKVDSPEVTEVKEGEEGVELLHSPVEEETPVEDELLMAPPVEDELLKAPEPASESSETVVAKPFVNEDAKEKMFQKFTSKDIVFLSIMAGCMLLTSAVMPLALSIQVFGIIHLMLGFQASFFPAIGMMKVRKPGALLYMTAVFTIVPLFIMPPVALGGLLCAVIVEALTLLIFRGYKNDGACLFAGTLFFPLGLPFMYAYYKLMFKDAIPPIGDGEGEIKKAVAAMVNVEPGFAVGITVAVLVLCFVGAILGVLTMRKLRKSGAIKK